MSTLVAPPRAKFAAEVSPIPAAARARMEGVSWRGDDPRCPRWDALAYLVVDHVTFDGATARGEIVVAIELAARAIELFRRLYQLGFPIRQIALVDNYGGSDDADGGRQLVGIQLPCRRRHRLALQHALGRAIDINPVENPWRKPDRIVPPPAPRSLIAATSGPACSCDRGPPSPRPTSSAGSGRDWRHASDDHHFVWPRGR
ncbi:MAG: hypothetical protein WKG01_38085 [Kofleriaceae bacterium]